MSFCGYIYISKRREGLRFRQWHAIIHTLYLLAHSYSQFWPMLLSDNAQMWFREKGSAGKHCGCSNCNDGAFSHRKHRSCHVTCPLDQKARPGP